MARHASSAARRIGLGLVVALVLARSFSVLYWADLHFDADQAVMGLMAKHVAEGRAFPLFQYAHAYVLVLEAWLAAPLMAMADSSIRLLKSVPVALNVATAALLYWVLTSSATAAGGVGRGASPGAGPGIGPGVGPGVALLATAPVALPGPNTTRTLTDALGMNIEPLFFALVLWCWRERPVILGITAAVAVSNRAFAVYAVVALLIVDLLRDRSAALWRGRILSLVAFALTWVSVGVLRQYSSPWGPGTEPATGPTLVPDGGAGVSTGIGAACLDHRFVPGDLWTTVTELLPYQLGVSTAASSIGHVLGGDIPSAPWLWAPLVAVLVAGTSRGVLRAWRHGTTAMTWLGLYLVLMGTLAVVAYAATRCGSASVHTLRYTLVSLLAPTGAIVLSLDREPRAIVRALVIGVVSVWVGVCAMGHVSVTRGLLRASPQGAYRELAEYLDAHEIRYIVTDYWTGYHVAFLTGERTKAQTTYPRIHDYTLAIRANPDRVVEVRRHLGEPCEGGVEVARFYVCLPPRSRARR